MGKWCSSQQGRGRGLKSGFNHVVALVVLVVPSSADWYHDVIQDQMAEVPFKRRETAGKSSQVSGGDLKFLSK